jgi:hypothetical protein
MTAKPEATNPRILKAINRTKGTVLCERLEDAGGLAGQSRGLLGRLGLEDDQGMLFENGRFAPFMWMHMFFMKFAIDIVFLDQRGRVKAINRELKPWRVSAMVFGARRAIELAAGAVARRGLELGDEVAIEENI